MEIVLIGVLFLVVAVLTQWLYSSNNYYDERLQAMQHDIETIAATRKSYSRELED